MEEMDKVYAFLLLVSITFLGLYLTRKEQYSLQELKRFAVKYIELLHKYYESHGNDVESYTWLIKKSHTIQVQMGGFGMLAHYQPAFRNTVYTNYPIILNMVPEIKNMLKDSLFHKEAQQYAQTIHESLIRYIGSLEERIEEKDKEVANPFIWFREGVKFLLIFPIKLLAWLGIVSDNIASIFYSNSFISIFSGILALIGLVGGVITIALGWDDFSSQIIQYYEVIIKSSY